jgi:hypothetical protein
MQVQQWLHNPSGRTHVKVVCAFGKRHHWLALQRSKLLLSTSFSGVCVYVLCLCLAEGAGWMWQKDVEGPWRKAQARHVFSENRGFGLRAGCLLCSMQGTSM